MPRFAFSNNLIAQVLVDHMKHIPSFLGLLREAMKLRSVCNGEKYNVESRRIRDEILTLVESPVKDGKLKGYFDLMKEKRHRFFLMAIIDTLSLRNEDAVAKLIDVLYELARDPKRDVTDLLWGKADKP